MPQHETPARQNAPRSRSAANDVSANALSLPAVPFLKPEPESEKVNVNDAVLQRVIQRNGDPPYKLSKGVASGLTEEKFVDDADPLTGVQFTAFTSCIGVVGLKAGKIVAAHLVVRGSSGGPVDPASVETVFDGATDIMVFGELTFWSAASNGNPITAALSKISDKVEDWEDKGSGTFKVTRVSDAWVIT